MKFLADMGISKTTLDALRNDGYDVVHLSEQGLQRLTDDKILIKAKDEKRIVLTCDLDFGDLLSAYGHNLPSVIIFRLSNFKPSFLNPRLFSVLKERKTEINAGAVIIVQDNRYRVRRLPINRER
ncbi:MAG: DUF5615 family PIN-like protein [bacterium]